jgi:hypothetical protein
MLKAIQLGQQLTKNEMKEVKGGGTCCAHYVANGCEDVGGGPVWICGLSKSQAMATADAAVGVETEQAFWCCASC